MKRILCFFIVLLLFLFVSCVSSDSPSSTTSPSDAVDLGLSVKWAKCNLGSITEEACGDYLAWGELSTKLDYSPDTYKWKDPHDPSSSEYGYIKYKSIDPFLLYLELSGKKEEEIPFVEITDKQEVYIDDPLYFRLEAGYHLDPADDPAHVRLGGKWRMPTNDEWAELRTKCSWAWMTVGGVQGYYVTGSTGNGIFLPVTGFKYDTTIQMGRAKDKLPFALYWSATLDSQETVYCNYFYYPIITDYTQTRYDGLVIRPVFGDYPLAPKSE